MASATYHPAETYSPRLDINSKARRNFFASPRTPSTTTQRTSFFPPAPTTDYSAIPRSSNPSNISRKRPRYDRSESSIYSPDNMSPAPLVNSNYRLAGGLDTPTAEAKRVALYNDPTPDGPFRRGPAFASTNEPKDYFHNYAGENTDRLPGRDSNGRAPAPVPFSAKASTTWGSMMFNLAGKVWDFCTSNFRGFHAGGGTGYSFGSSQPTPVRPSPLQRMESSGWIHVPEATSDNDYDINPRVSKKTKTSHTSDLRDSWVMIGSPSRNRSREPSPSISYRRPSTPTFPNASSAPTRRTPSAIPRPSLFLRRDHTANSARPASSAGLRSPQPGSPSAPSARPGQHRRSSSFNSHLGHKAKDRRQPNVGRPATPNAGSGSDEVQRRESPMARQTAQYLEGQRKREAKEDRELSKLSRRLEDLIRQGKEALGTRVEMETHDEWSDGDGDGAGDAGMPGRW
ncbi:MAG: hypothetical protein LQ340_003197 [Diploschistes diacapsis]|nr:MAG: hypothetical protein LQ340_003197 [Diploschistes diacapsis]